jgi:ribonuclease BN (tRNA processing enzyme)
MRLTVVGCSGSMPGPESAASCYLLEAPYDGRTFRLLLDLGSGALGPLQRYADLESIDAVALSHLHADHCLDLCGFYVFRRFRPGGALRPLPVYGPDGTADRLAHAYDLDPDPGMRPELDFRSYPTEPFPLGPFTASVTPVDHPPPAVALRLTDGTRTLVYSGDTGPTPALVDLARGCDVLLAEAAFLAGPNNAKHLHMTGAEAAAAAEQAGAGRLVLTHVPPWYCAADVLKEAAPHFSGPSELAKAGARFDV